MTTLRFGQACDLCPRSFPDYNQGSDIGTCNDCQADMCAGCAHETRHARREVDGLIILTCEGGCNAV